MLYWGSMSLGLLLPLLVRNRAAESSRIFGQLMIEEIVPEQSGRYGQQRH